MGLELEEGELDRSSLIKKADSLFSFLIRKSGACRRCGSTSGIDCAHIVGRTVLSLRWNPDNAMPLCRNCHRYFHDNPVDFRAFVGYDKFSALEAIKNRMEKVHTFEIELIVKKLIEAKGT